MDVEDYGPGDCGNGNDCRNDCDDPPTPAPVSPLMLHSVAPSMTQTWLWLEASAIPVMGEAIGLTARRGEVKGA
jgi:hypothetical protein